MTTAARRVLIKPPRCPLRILRPAHFSTTRRTNSSNDLEEDIAYLKFREHLFFAEKKLHYESLAKWLDDNFPKAADVATILNTAGRGDYICVQKLELQNGMAHISEKIKKQLLYLREHDKDLEREPYPEFDPTDLGQSEREEREREGSDKAYLEALSADVVASRNEIKRDLEKLRKILKEGGNSGSGGRVLSAEDVRELERRSLADADDYLSMEAEDTATMGGFVISESDAEWPKEQSLADSDDLSTPQLGGWEDHNAQVDELIEKDTPK